uniref:Secreted protein n=1 Tax=Mastacembelus armatus TaxID=205130 RepID=A0A3Q3MTG4_9TELE
MPAAAAFLHLCVSVCACVTVASEMCPLQPFTKSHTSALVALLVCMCPRVCAMVCVAECLSVTFVNVLICVSVCFCLSIHLDMCVWVFYRCSGYRGTIKSFAVCLLNAH